MSERVGWRGSSRRAFLGGAAATLALPWLPSLLRGARASEAPPLRLLWWYCPNGMHMPSFRPVGAGSTYTLSPTLAALAPHRQDLTIVGGLNNVEAPRNDAPHSVGMAGFLTGVVAQPGAVSLGRSVDQRAAERMGRNNPFPSLQIGCEGVPANDLCWPDYSCAYSQHLSWADTQTPLPMVVSPQLLFNRLFGGFDATATAQERARRLTLRTSVLDVVADETEHLLPVLGVEDRSRLDRYLTSVRELERRLELLGSEAPCEGGADPLAGDDREARTDAFSELIALAFACDLTRVVSFAQGNGGSGTTYDFLGVPGAHHALSHHANNERMIRDLITIETWEVARFAELLRVLKTFDEGDGNLLDHTVAVFGSGLSDGDWHKTTDLPLILAGKGGGAHTPGRFVNYPDRPLLDLHLTALAAVGVPLPPWGPGTGPITDLLT